MPAFTTSPFNTSNADKVTPYCIKPGYAENLNPAPFDDTPFKDEYQDEVYRKAREIADGIGAVDITDFGTGSGFKLMKHFPEPPFYTLGVDTPETVAWLRQTYPLRAWTSDTLPEQCDLLIASDVIEHLLNPDDLVEYIIACGPKVAVLSTPNRDLIPDMKCQKGPTGTHHVREWNFEELAAYLGKPFRIINHYMSDRKNCTQLMVLGLR